MRLVHVIEKHPRVERYMDRGMWIQLGDGSIVVIDYLNHEGERLLPYNYGPLERCLIFHVATP